MERVERDVILVLDHAAAAEVDMACAIHLNPGSIVDHYFVLCRGVSSFMFEMTQAPF